MSEGCANSDYLAHGHLFSVNSATTSHQYDAKPVVPRISGTWIDSLLNDVRKGVINILTIWDDIGIDSSAYEKRKMLLRKHVVDLFDAMLSEERTAVENLRKSVRESEESIKRLRIVLGISGKDIEGNTTLIARERQLSKLHKELSEVASTNIELYKSLVAEQESICNRLEEQPKIFHFDFAPSVGLLQTIDFEVQELKRKLNRRLEQLENIDAEIERMNPRVLNMMPDKDGTCKLESWKLDEMENGSVKEEYASETYYPHTFQSVSHKGIDSPRRLDEYDALQQVQPSGEATRQTPARLRESILTSLKDLHNLFDECLVDFEARKQFPRFPSEISFTPYYLTKLENEIVKWQNYRTRHTDAIAAFFSWRANLEQLMKIENQLTHPNSPMNRAKSDRECQTLRRRILPLLEKRLLEAASDDEGFLVFGVPPKTYLNDTWMRIAQPQKSGNQSVEINAQLKTKDAFNVRQLHHPDKFALPPKGTARTNMRTALRQASPAGLASGRGLPRIQPEKNLIPIMNMCTPSRLAASNIPGLNLNNKTVAKDGDQSALSSAKEQEAVFAMPTAPPRSAHKIRRMSNLKDATLFVTPTKKKTTAPPSSRLLRTPIRSANTNNTTNTAKPQPPRSPLPPSTPTISRTTTGLRTPRSVISASCSRLHQLTPRLPKLLEASPASLSVTDLFGYGHRQRSFTQKEGLQRPTHSSRVSISSIKRKIAAASASVERNRTPPPQRKQSKSVERPATGSRGRSKRPN